MTRCLLMKLIRVNSRQQRQTKVVSRNQSGRLVKSDSTASDVSQTGDRSYKTILPYSKYFKYVGIPIVVLLLIGTIAAALLLVYKTVNPATLDKPEADPNNTTQTNLVIDKRTWGGEAELSSVPLQHPTPFVIIGHTVTPVCVNFEKCSRRVLSIQQYHVGHLGSPDIGYNFLVGGDGNVYEGRGWNAKNFQRPNSIMISFIGNYLYDFLSADMINATQQLLEEGVRNGKLSVDYKLICHNQTAATVSPGPHVFEVVSTWPHYTPGHFDLEAFS